MFLDLAYTDGFFYPQHRTLHLSLFQHEIPVSIKLQLLKVTSLSSTPPGLFLWATSQGLTGFFDLQENTCSVYWCWSQLLGLNSHLQWMCVVAVPLEALWILQILGCFVQFLLDSANANSCRMTFFPVKAQFQDAEMIMWFYDTQGKSANTYRKHCKRLPCFCCFALRHHPPKW